MSKREIDCPQCKTQTIVRKEPVYDGFKKTGEIYICTGCGLRFDTKEATPFVEAKKPLAHILDIIEEPDALAAVFSDDERQSSCGWCRHFVVNPFAQRCGLTNREVEATEWCESFERRKE